MASEALRQTGGACRTAETQRRRDLVGWIARRSRLASRSQFLPFVAVRRNHKNDETQRRQRPPRKSFPNFSAPRRLGGEI